MDWRIGELILAETGHLTPVNDFSKRNYNNNKHFNHNGDDDETDDDNNNNFHDNSNTCNLLQFIVNGFLRIQYISPSFVI